MNYQKIKDGLVVPKIKTFGKSVFIRRPGSSVGWTKSWDVAQSRNKWTLNISPFTVIYTDPAGIPIDLPGHAIEKQYRQQEINGTTVMANDRRFLIADISSPTTADKLVVGGSILTIVNVGTIQPGDTALVYQLQCRGV